MTPNTFYLDAAKAKKEVLPMLRVVNQTTVLPILADVLIQQRKSCISFSATDLETIVDIEIPCESTLETDFCFDALSFKSLIKDSLSEQIEFRVCDSDRLAIKNGDFKLSFLSDKASDFPKQPTLSDYVTFSASCKDLIRLFKNALQFVSKDDLRPAMTGVCLYDYEGNLSVVATDAHRLYWDAIFETPEAFKNCKFIIPANSIRAFIEIFKDGNVEVQIDKNHARFYQSGKSLICRTVDARYPDFATVIPKQDYKFDLKRKHFSAFLKLAQSFTNQSTYQMKVSLEADRIKFLGEDADFSMAFDYSLPIYNSDCKHKYETAFNISFLKQLLKINEKDEYVRVQHSGVPTRAITIDGCSLIMPLMIN